VGLAYVVLAHKLPHQLGRLLRRIDHPDDVALVHVDAKKPIEPFRRELEPLLQSGRVRFTRARVRCHWGGPGHLRATLAAAGELLDSGHDFSHSVLLTGQDYPIRPLAHIRGFCDEHAGESFLSWSLGEGRDVPDSERAGNERWRWNGRLDRLKRRHFELPRRKRPVSFPNRFMPWVPERRASRTGPSRAPRWRTRSITRAGARTSPASSGACSRPTRTTSRWCCSHRRCPAAS
jgi:hypothetical protein